MADSELTYKARYVQDVLAELERSLSADRRNAILAQADADYIKQARQAQPVENVAGKPLVALFRIMRQELGDDGYLEWWRGYVAQKLVHIPLLSGLLQAAVKVLGLTPHTLLKNLPRARGSLVRAGGSMVYERVDENAARLTLLEYPRELLVSGIAGITMRGVYEGVLKFAGVNGVAVVEEESVGLGRVVHIIRWGPKPS